METKFYVGQRVNSLQSGNGTVESINGPLSLYPIVIKFDTPNPSLSNYRTIDGKIFVYSPIDLFPIYPPRVVLTEWQRNQLYEKGTNHWSCDGQFLEMLDIIESILSEPEPPKYQPKQGEAVLVKVCKDYPWVTGVFSNMEYDAYKCYGVSPVNFCRPFDASLVGKVTNE